MRKYNISLTATSVLFILFALLAVIVGYYLSFELSKKYLFTHELQYLRAVTDARGSELLFFLDAKSQRIQDLTSDRFIIDEMRKNVRGAKDSSALRQYLVNQKMPTFKYIDKLLVLSLDGRVIASTDPSLMGKDESREDYFTNIQKNILITEKDTGGPELVFTHVIYDYISLRPIGAVAGFLPVVEVERILKGEHAMEHLQAKVRRTELEALEIVIINRDRLLLSRSPFVKDSVLRQRADTLPVVTCQEKNQEVTGIFRDYRGVEVAGASLCLPSLGWTVVYKVDKRAIAEPASTMGRRSLVAVIATILLIGILGIYFTRHVAMQLRSLSKASREMALGNYDIILPVRTMDEVGVLSESFNEMARKIKERSGALKESETRYRTLIESLQEGILAVDNSGVITFVNPKMADMLGYAPSDMVGVPIFSFVDEKDFAKTRRQLEKRGRGMQEYGEIEYLKRDGSRIFARIGVSPIMENGEYRGATIGVMDITDRKIAEEEVLKLNRELEARVEARTRELENAISDLAAASRDIETFTYSVAHDLKNPLMLVDGFSNILIKKLKDKLDVDAQEHILRIRETIKRMGQLVDDLLNLSFAMRAELRYETVDISALANSIALDLKKAEPERIVDFSIEDGLAARCDEKLIRLVFENLISNAWKFTSKKAEQRIEIGSAGEKDGREVFFVRDNGAGFDMKDQDKLFKPFQRLHPAAQFPGTGIGLSTVRRIILRHGGETWAEGSPGVGAAFFFTLERGA